MSSRMYPFADVNKLNPRPVWKGIHLYTANALLALGSLTELRQENSIELPGCHHGSLQSANHLLGPMRIALGSNWWRRPWRWFWSNRSHRKAWSTLSCRYSFACINGSFRRYH